MAELQNFLVVVENNRDEAIRIAGVTAQSKLVPPPRNGSFG